MILGSQGLGNFSNSGGAAASGIFFNFPKGQQYTSYRAGDEGSRVQSGYFNITLPTSPQVIAQLDYSLGSSYWYRLAQPLTVGGVSNTIRFVDVNGMQVWGAANNVVDILIDKYTGMGFYRNINALPANVVWNDAIDNALAFSTTVQGVTFDTFYLASAEEYLLLGGQLLTNGWVDPISSASIINNTAGYVDFWTSTTVPINTLRAYEFNPNPQMSIRTAFDKTTTGLIKNGFYTFDARSLITI